MRPAIPSRLTDTPPAPIMEAQRWLSLPRRDPDLPLINVSQAAPVAPPPPALTNEMARLVRDEPEVHLYGPVLGLPDLRAEIAARWSAAYGGRIWAEEVAITTGCNQAFCAAIASLAAPGDAVILPSPWYFNHAMWLQMAGVETRALPCGADMLPDPERAAGLIDDRTRAIALVSPNNPTGTEYPPELIAEFAALARDRGIALVIDETYRDYLSSDAPPHGIFAEDWQDVLIHLYSFSKVFRLTGHRVGALIAGRERLAQIEKFLDTVTICPTTLGQRAALFGLRHLGDWVAEERAEIAARREVARRLLGALPGWTVKGCGGYFTFLEHPFEELAAELAARLVQEQSVLLLPGSMFTPAGDPSGARHVRVAVANSDAAGIAALAERLDAATP